VGEVEGYVAGSVWGLVVNLADSISLPRITMAVPMTRKRESAMNEIFPACPLTFTFYTIDTAGKRGHEHVFVDH
jgi:hypothetical protein